MLNRLMNWWRGRKKPPARLNPLILRTYVMQQEHLDLIEVALKEKY